MSMRATRTFIIVRLRKILHATCHPEPRKFYADVVAATAGKVLLCEAAPRVRASIALRFANNPKLQVVAPQEVERLSQHSLDFIVLHSVTQYLTPYEAGTLLALFHRLLDRSGILIVSDVITPADSKAAIRKPLAAPSRNSAAASIILESSGVITSLTSSIPLRSNRR